MKFSVSTIMLKVLLLGWFGFGTMQIAVSGNDEFLVCRGSIHNMSALRGAPGVPGTPGPQGIPGIMGARGPPGVQDVQRISNIENRLETLSGRMWKAFIRQYHMDNELRTWQEARTYCQSIGGDLITSGMRNPTTRRSIIEQLIKPAGHRNYWIGLHDTETEGSWEWIDGVPSTPENTDFQPGEPNNRGGGGHDADCGQIFFAYNFRFDDVICRKTQRAICEKYVLI